MNDSRPRNNHGQFAPETQGELDANNTSAAYNPQVIESRKATLGEKLRRAIGLRGGVEESVPERVLSSKLRLRELADLSAEQVKRPKLDSEVPVESSGPILSDGARNFRNVAVGVGALGAGGGVLYASKEVAKAARSARRAAIKLGRVSTDAKGWAKAQFTTFPTFKKWASMVFEENLQGLKELAARSGRLVEFAKEINVDDISGNYIEHPGRKRHIVGGVAGSTIGLIAGMGLAAKLKAGSGLGVVGAIAGGAGGSMLADPHGSKERKRQMREARHALRESWQAAAVPVESIKSNIPIASSYTGVAGELKKQKVGFFRRHGAALATGGIRSSENAAFLPYGDKGVIVSPKRVPKIVIRHEQGHGKDYSLHGDFEKLYPKYGKNTWDSREYLQNTLLPEERAWRHANPRAEKEKKLKDALLGSYAAVGGFTRKPTINQP